MSLVFAGPETPGFFQRRCTSILVSVSLVLFGILYSAVALGKGIILDNVEVTGPDLREEDERRKDILQMEGARGLLEKLNPTQGLQAPAEPDTNDRAVNERDCEETGKSGGPGLRQQGP